MPKPFKLALCQMRVVGGDKPRNLARAVEMIAEAAARGADVALLPECIDLGWTGPSSLTQAESIPDGAPCAPLAQAARAHRIYATASTTPPFSSTAAARSCASTASSTSSTSAIGSTRKATAWRSWKRSSAAWGCSSAPTPRRRISRSRARSATWERTYCVRPAPGRFRPTTTTRAPYGEPWRSAYGAAAREFSMPIFGVSNVGSIDDGPWAGRKCIGCSWAVDAAGREILQGPYGEDAESLILIEVIPVARPARGTSQEGRA